MGKLTNWIIGLLVIAIGIMKLTNFSLSVPDLVFSFILLVLGYFTIRSSKIFTSGGGRRRHWLQWFIGIILSLLAILEIITMLFGAIIPYTEVLAGNAGGIIIIVLGALIIIMSWRDINL